MMVVIVIQHLFVISFYYLPFDQDLDHNHDFNHDSDHDNNTGHDQDIALGSDHDPDLNHTNHDDCNLAFVCNIILIFTF